MNGLSHWNGLKYFSPDGKQDNWGDPHKMSRDLLLELDKFRDYLGLPVFVTSGFRSNNRRQEGSSEHCYGNAVDVIVPDFRGSILDLFFAASRFKFTGIGLYRDWEYKGKRIGGLHLDVRDAPYRALWFCYKPKLGQQEYLALSVETLRGYNVL